MRHLLSMGVVALALAGCVAPVTPVVQPAPAPTPAPAPAPAPAPVLDAAARTVASTAINREMARRLPGVNVAPYTDCVVNNASMAELADIARASGNASATANAVAAIVRRPEASQCIARVAATA